MLTWINGQLVDELAASVSVFDHSLNVGDGVFETVKVVEGIPFALERHLDRLGRSAAGLGLPAPERSTIRKACLDVVNHLDDAGMYRLRITYTGGPSRSGSMRDDDISPTLIVTVASLPLPASKTTVATVPWPRNERGALAGIKSTSFAENVVALARARAAGATEALFCDTQSRLCEGTGSNVFVVVDGQLMTPSLASGCLAGVTRALVLEWTQATETDLSFDTLHRAEEVFLTSTLRNIQAVTAVLFDEGRRDLVGPGPVTADVAAVFAERSGANPEP